MRSFLRSFFLISLFFGSFPALAEHGGTVGSISVQGNQRVEESTILNYAGLSSGQPYSTDVINAALKSLFATGFFSDAHIIPVGTSGSKVDISIDVVENPVVNKVAFEGNKAVEDKDLQGELELKPRAIYTRTKVQSDVKRILDIFRRGGRYSAEVTPKTIQRDQNRVDIVYEIKEGTIARVKKISFIGNENYTSSQLLKRIRTEEARWYKFLSSDDKYDPERMQYDQELLRRFYTSEGYADFQVKSAYAELSPAKDYFTIVFTIEEGQKYSFGKVDIASSLKGVDQGQLKGIISTQAGNTYDGSKIESSIDALVKELGNKGYAFVEIEPKVERNTADRKVDLVYNVKEGPRVYIEKINIVGNVRTLDEVVRRELRVVEGDPFNTAKIARSEQRLNNLGFFEKVKLTNTQGSSRDKTILNVEVQEKSTGEISLGGGYSTTDGPLAEFGIRESNFLGRGQDLRFSTTVSGARQQYDISFTEPYFLDRELSAGFDLFKTQLNVSSQTPYQLDNNGAKLRLGYALTEKWTQFLNYTYKRTDVTDIQSDASIFIIRQAGQTTQSSVGQTISFENRDNRLSPTSGGFFRLSQDVAGLGGDTRWLRHEITGAYFYPIAPKWVASMNGAGGYIFGFSKDVGIQDRFFLGGQSFRGFENYGVGPHAKSTGDALGGTSYFTVSPELAFPLGLPDDLGFTGQVFAQAGSLWNSQETGTDVSDNNKVRITAGGGVSWASPFGPIRIDLTHAIVKEKYDRTQIFQFNFGTRF